MIKFLHCADLHLDSPFSLDDPRKAEQRRAELRGAFTSMMLYAKTEGVDLVLMAGDLFDSEYAGRDTAALMAREFASNPKCRFIIAPGNHDPYTPDSIWARFQFPENVYVFDADKLSYFSFDDIGVDVYGYAFTGPSMQQNPFAGKKPRNTERINLLCAHGDLGAPVSQYCPISPGDVQQSGFDYIALGHKHNTNGIERTGNTYYGYSGCLEGRDFGETGHKGAIYVKLEKTEAGELHAEIRGLRFSKRRYEVARLNVTGCFSDRDIVSRIQKMIIEKRFGADTALRCILEGELPPSLCISEKRLADSVQGLFSIDIVNSTAPMAGADTLAEDPTIKGAVYSALLPKLQSGTPEERETAARALRLIFDALAGRPLADDDA